MSQRTATTRIGAGLSTSPGTRAAGQEAARAAAAGLMGDPDLAFLFLSPAHLDDVEEAVEAVRGALEPAHLVGCVAEGVLGGSREVEEGPGLVVWAATLPGAEIEPFHVSALELEDSFAVTGFPDVSEASLVTLFVDPYTFPSVAFLDRLNEERPWLPLVGGIAAGGGTPDSQALIVDGEIESGGAVGAVVRGAPVHTVVSQGCAPIGREAIVTRAEGNVVYELAGESALERLRDDLIALPSEQQELAANGLLAGIVIDENKPEYERGDFLMRGLLGADGATGALAIGAPVRTGQTIRFHVRDAASADDDLRHALARTLVGARGVGALLFTCNGRGTNMFPAPDHDARVVGEALGSGAVAGFFCGGEIGPVGGQTFLHGFTATLAVFLDA